MINLILFGAPGSGKGTQAAKLVAHYNLYHISTGDLFRYEISNSTPLGIEAKTYMSRGELVPDAITIGMLRNKVMAHPEVEGFIFDGFPRTDSQALALDQLLQSLDQAVSALIELVVDENEIVKRLIHRGESSGRPDDKDEEIIRNRIAVYQKQTAMVYDYYDKSEKSQRVAGMGDIETIFESICKKIDAIV